MKKWNLSFLFVAALAVLWSCKKDDSPTSPEAVEINYAFANVAGASPNATTYVTGTKDLNFTNLTTGNGAEQANFASMWRYKQDVYLTASGAPATMTRYSFDNTGKPVVAGKLVVPGANTFSSVEFINDSVAFASVGGGLARVVRFHPTEFRITGEVNLTPILKTGATSTFYLGMKSRSGKLFMGVHYFNGPNPLYDSAYVAVIDIAQSKVDKLIADGRTCAIFQSGSSVNAFALDATGDIYILGLGSAKVPSGIVRIKNGETNFDPSYFFDLKAAAGKDCRNLWHFGNGLTFTTRVVEPSDPFELNGPNYEFYKIDLANKTSLGKLSTLPKVFGSSAATMRKFDDNEILFVVAGANENAMYSFKISDGSVSRKFTMAGNRCTGFYKLK